MKITRATTWIVGNPWKNWLFLRLDTDEDGVYGVGEGTINGFAKTTEMAVHEMASRFEGFDPFQIETILQRMARDLYTEGGQIHMNAIAAVEVACWDIIGKVTGRPIYDLIGGRYHQTLPAYANGWYAGPRTPESFAERAQLVLDRGYKEMKFDPFGAAWRTMTPQDRQLSIDIIAAVREVCGPEIKLMIEGHSRFSVHEAVWIGERIAEYEPTWFEEPTPHQNIASTVEVARKIAVPVATGESYSSTHQFADLLSNNAVSILQPEPGSMGGIWRTRQVAAMADAFYGVVAPHNAQGPISTATCIQISASCANLLTQEIFDDFNVGWEKDLVSHHAEVIDGRIQIPDRPGLGVDLNTKEFEKHPYETTNFIPLFAPGWERREGEVPLPSPTE